MKVRNYDPNTSKKYRENNRDKVLAARKKWRDSNKGKGAAHCKQRQAAKLQRTVPWADTDKIAELYQAAKAMDFFNPCTKHHVDHVIPLQGDIVSGLHVHNNLQILTESENCSKGNSFREERVYG